MSVVTSSATIEGLSKAWIHGCSIINHHFGGPPLFLVQHPHWFQSFWLPHLSQENGEESCWQCSSPEIRSIEDTAVDSVDGQTYAQATHTCRQGCWNYAPWRGPDNGWKRENLLCFHGWKKATWSLKPRPRMPSNGVEAKGEAWVPLHNTQSLDGFTSFFGSFGH